MQVLLKIFLQARQAERAAQGDDLFDSRIAMHRRIKPDAALNFGDEVGEDRPHRLENLPGVFAGVGVALEFFGLGEGQLEALDQHFGEIVSADGDRSQPDRFAVGDDQIGVFRAEIDDHRRALEAAVVIHRVVDGQRIHLHDLDVEIDIGEMLDDVLVDQLPPHGEDADFDIGRFGRLEKLVAPFDIIQRKGNLLDGFEADDFGNFLGFDGGKLDETGEAGDAADADGGDAALGCMALDEIGQGRSGSALLYCRRRWRERFRAR